MHHVMRRMRNQKVNTMEIDIATLLSSLGISAATAAWLAKSLVSQQLSKELQEHKNELDKSLSKFRSEQEAEIRKGVDIFIKENEALIKYKSEAKARLYHAIGPLKFQLLLAARDYKVRATGIPRNPYDINIDGHYGKSTIFRLARLLCLAELIERQVAYADFSVDESAVKLLEFKKSLFLLLSGSKITCHHPKVDWQIQKEHIFFDVLSNIGNALILDEDGNNARCMSFSEFTSSLDDKTFSEQLSPLTTAISNLRINETPILWVRLACVTELCNSLIFDLGRPIGFKHKDLDLEKLIRESSDEFIQRKADKFVQLCHETMNEGL